MQQNLTAIIKGNQIPSGKVKVSGAKNSALHLLAASLLTDDIIRLKNYPSYLQDIIIHERMLEKIGKRISRISEDEVNICKNSSIASELIWNERSIRNTLLILGVTVARTGYGKVPLPGGCKIGERKYDLHEMLLKALGARVWYENGYLMAESKRRLKGNDIHLPIRSTGATINGILCGTLAEGRTTIWNPHIRPEIIDLVYMLNKMGAKISVFGQERIEIVGVDILSGCEHTVIPDNMEALTWFIAATVTNGDIEIVDFPRKHLEVPLIFLRESGANYYFGQNSVIARGGSCYPIDISTGPYPGINSDMQPLFAIYGAMSGGISKIIDLRFPGRYQYMKELSKMGVEYAVSDELLTIKGGERIIGTEVTALDLRAGAALLLAGLVAEGETRIKDFWQIERGYNNIREKAKKLGIQIQFSD